MASDSTPRTALVTGANRGLGLETCAQLARRGFRVILTSRTGGGEPAARRLAQDGLAVEHRHLDVTDEASVASLAAGLARERVVLDVLVNNAGIAMDGFDARVARATLDVNFWGALRVTDGLLTRIRDGGDTTVAEPGECVARGSDRGGRRSI